MGNAQVCWLCVIIMIFKCPHWKWVPPPFLILISRPFLFSVGHICIFTDSLVSHRATLLSILHLLLPFILFLSIQLKRVMWVRSKVFFPKFWEFVNPSTVWFQWGVLAHCLYEFLAGLPMYASPNNLTPIAFLLYYQMVKLCDILPSRHNN